MRGGNWIKLYHHGTECPWMSLWAWWVFWGTRMTLNLLIFSTDIMYILNPCCLCSVALWNILYRNSVPFQKFIRKYQIFKDFSRNFAMSENKSAFSGIYMVSLVQIGNIRIRTNFWKSTVPYWKTRTAYQLQVWREGYRLQKGIFSIYITKH